MRSYWIWLAIMGVAWLSAVLHYSGSLAEMQLRVIGSACFFALYFLSPLLTDNRRGHFLLFIAMAGVAVAVFWPDSEGSPNLYMLPVFSILAGKAVYRLEPKYAATIGFILLAGSLLPGFLGYAALPPVFLLIYAFLLGAAFTVLNRLLEVEEQARLRNEALLTEYRKMKRQLLSDEKLARQDERTQIAHDLHDSVGHKLTALLMQLEVFRLQADGQTAAQLQELKTLAKESLEDTRSAVKTLKQDEAGGLTAVIALIRKLEAESFLRIEFSVKAGAISASLRNDQMIIVYRAVQEALTNIMRHSNSRVAEIVFEAPGGSVFRFAISNDSPEKVEITEGFGLSAMRERIEGAGGRLDIIQAGKGLTIQGTLPLQGKEEVGT